MELRAYIESFSQFESGLSIAQKIEKGRTKLFDFDYPIFNEQYRKDFETHFIRHFYMREIGAETEGLFKFNLETWLLINMPYFNKLFESELLDYNPLTNSKMGTTHKKTVGKNQTVNTDGSQTVNSDGTRNTNGSSTSNDDNFQRSIEADTPDTRLNLTTNDGQGILEYASNVGENNQNNKNTTSSDVDENTTANSEANTSQNSESNSDETEDFTLSREGKIGVQTYAKMIQEHRQAFLRIEKDMFKEMQDLFMLVY